MIAQHYEVVLLGFSPCEGNRLWLEIVSCHGGFDAPYRSALSRRHAAGASHRDSMADSTTDLTVCRSYPRHHPSRTFFALWN